MKAVDLVCECKEESVDVYINGELYLNYYLAHGVGAARIIPTVTDITVKSYGFTVTELKWTWG